VLYDAPDARDSPPVFCCTRSGADALAHEPFVGPDWSDRLLAEVPNGDAYRGASTSPRITSGSDPAKPTSLMARGQVSSFDARKEAFQDVLFDTGNPAWDVIDRRRAVDALEHFASLSMVERRELYGAVTAALWLETN
jgi:hypothetical protein